MKIEVEKITITGGEFRVLPGDSGLEGADQKDQLIINCQFAMVNKKGESVSTGYISNSPNAQSAMVPLSSSTLEAFHKFFNYLEHDVANALSAEDTDDESSVAALLGRI